MLGHAADDAAVAAADRGMRLLVGIASEHDGTVRFEPDSHVEGCWPVGSEGTADCKRIAAAVGIRTSKPLMAPEQRAGSLERSPGRSTLNQQDRCLPSRSLDVGYHSSSAVGYIKRKPGLQSTQACPPGAFGSFITPRNAFIGCGGGGPPYPLTPASYCCGYELLEPENDREGV